LRSGGGLDKSSIGDRVAVSVMMRFRARIIDTAVNCHKIIKYDANSAKYNIEYAILSFPQNPAKNEQILEYPLPL
jgi:hypothetical protein